MLNELERKIVDISYEQKLSHLSSCLNTVGILDHIYTIKDRDDIVVLGNSHAALALFVVLEKHEGKNAKELQKRHGTHANRNLEDGIYVSGGSLGQAETVAVGLAMANRDRNVYLVTSDGACAEGSVWEALRVAADYRLENLRVTVIANGYSGYDKTDVEALDTRLNAFYPTLVVRTNVFKFPEWLQGVAGHYVVMNEEMYKEITNG